MTNEAPNTEEYRPWFMHPVVFLSAWQLLAVPFAVQEYFQGRVEGYNIPLWNNMKFWSIHFLLWGVFCLCMWHLLRRHIQKAPLRQIFLIYLPLSTAVSLLQVSIFLLLYHNPTHGPHHTYLQRLKMYVAEEFVTNVAIFWIVFAFFRAIGQYEKYRQREMTASRLEVQLTNARLQALRMQLNPHFLFNALNSVSSLMRTDIEVADEMLERLSSLLRITLEQGDEQKIRLREEIEIVQLYVSIQQLRYGDRVRHLFQIAPETWDYLVPTMILQPIVENAYVHGVSKSIGQATIEIQTSVKDERLQISIRNTCSGLNPAKRGAKREGLGIANVKARLQLHYADLQDFLLRKMAPDDVTALFVLPIETRAYSKEENPIAVYTNSNTDRR